jgi:hypothetical protein
MLIQLLTQHPEAVGTVLKNTPTWVWGLLAGLMTLGITQLRDGNPSVVRVTVMPVAMTIFSVWGNFTAFGASSQFGTVLVTWFTAAAVVGAALAMTTPPATYDPATRSFHVPGSWIPLALILGIFMTKYVVGVELNMQPQLARDGQFTVIVAGLYGVFNGLFVGRAIRLWRLALRSAAPSPSAVAA